MERVRLPLLTLTTIWLFAGPLKWLLASLHAPEYRLHGALLLAYSFYLAWRAARARWAIVSFQMRWAPLALFGLGLTAFSLLENRLRIDVLSCLAMGLVIFALVGFIVSPAVWLRSAPLAMLFAVCLPLSYHLETFVGFPLRLLSARVVVAFFSLLGDAAQSTETVLRIENQYAHVDLPCSGMKGLWSISLFVLVISVARGLKIGSRWVALLGASWVFVAGANVFRILALVTVAQTALPEKLKSLLHAPIGLLGFLVAAGATSALVSRFAQVGPPGATEGPRFSARAFAFVLAAMTVCALLSKPSPDKASAVRSVAGAGELSSAESDLFLRHGVLRYYKREFQMGRARGTAFLVLAKSWRGHHHPEQCLRGQGGETGESRTLLVNGHPCRTVELRNRRQTLIYWFQSAEEITDDYASRAWAGLIHPGRMYVMVSVYVEGAVDAELTDLVQNFHRQAEAMLQEESGHEK